MKSQAQRAYLHIHHPKVAKEFERETPKGKKLPKKAKKQERADMEERKEKDTPKHLRWDYLRHGISAGADGLSEAKKKSKGKDMPKYHDVMERFSELESTYGSGYKQVEGGGRGPGGFGVTCEEDGYPYNEHQIGEEGPPKDKVSEGRRIDEATLDMGQLKDPAKFIDGVAAFADSLQKDMDVLKSFARSHTGKLKGGAATKPDTADTVPAAQTTPGTGQQQGFAKPASPAGGFAKKPAADDPRKAKAMPAAKDDMRSPTQKKSDAERYAGRKVARRFWRSR